MCWRGLSLTCLLRLALGRHHTLFVCPQENPLPARLRGVSGLPSATLRASTMTTVAALNPVHPASARREGVLRLTAAQRRLTTQRGRSAPAYGMAASGHFRPGRGQQSALWNEPIGETSQ